MRAAARRRSVDIWPGFVDALAALLMVVVFVLLIFTLGQFFLSDRLSGSERALARLEIQVAELGELLSLEQATTQTLSQRLATLDQTLTQTRGERDGLAGELAERTEQLNARLTELAGLERDVASLRELRAELEREVLELAGSLDSARRESAVQTELAASAQAQVLLLNRQVAALRDQLTQISAALDLAEQEKQAQAQQIDDLGRRLNLAMASKVQQLEAYRSDFFGRLKEVLGDNPDLRVEGDRFVFQSELLFATGSAQLGDEGRAQVRRLANVLSEVQGQIPPDIDWVLRIDGHTDRRPITTAEFPSNWELSTDRALAIVKYLIALGINPRRLAATGFGEYHPLDTADNELAFARNRRIELKLTAR